MTECPVARNSTVSRLYSDTVMYHRRKAGTSPQRILTCIRQSLQHQKVLLKLVVLAPQSVQLVVDHRVPDAELSVYRNISVVCIDCRRIGHTSSLVTTL